MKTKILFPVLGIGVTALALAPTISCSPTEPELSFTPTTVNQTNFVLHTVWDKWEGHKENLANFEFVGGIVQNNMETMDLIPQSVEELEDATNELNASGETDITIDITGTIAENVEYNAYIVFRYSIGSAGSICNITAEFPIICIQ